MIGELRGEVIPCKCIARVLPVESDTAQRDPVSLEFLANGGKDMLLGGLEHAVFLRRNSSCSCGRPRSRKFGDILTELLNGLLGLLKSVLQDLVREVISQS